MKCYKLIFENLLLPPIGRLQCDPHSDWTIWRKRGESEGAGRRLADEFPSALHDRSFTVSQLAAASVAMSVFWGKFFE